MIADKVPWIGHDGGPIFSIDVHPSGEKLVTSGQDNKIRIWNLLPALHEQYERDPSVPRVLATMENHLCAVNVVRFSHNGQYLASGADDKIVCIFQLQAGQAKAAFGSNQVASLENWRQFQSLRGHDNNVVDLAWSPDDKFVATASLDNLVIIWDVASGGRVAVLSGHQGFVKGVAWDPFNVFVASQGENDGVFIWRVSDWSLVKKIKEPLGDTCSVAFHTRLGWSPDGQILAAANAFDSSHLAPLIQRNTWTSDHSYVGHRAPVVVVRYNPRFFYPLAKSGSLAGDEACTIAVLGSSDKQFSIWSPMKKTPLCVGTKLFRGGVMDAAWTPDGYSLFLASYDGTVAAVRFKEEEIGKVIPEKEVQELFSALYGDPTVRMGSTLAESVEVLRLEKEAAAADNPQADKENMGALPQAKSQLPPQLAGVAASGLMTKLSDRLGAGGAGLSGSASSAAASKKRVQPTAVQPPTSLAAARPAPSSTAASQQPSTAKVGSQPPAKRLAMGPPPSPGPASVTTPRANPPQKRAPSAAQEEGVFMRTCIQPPPITQKVSIRLGRRPAGMCAGQEEGGMLSLEACNNAGRDQRGRAYAELVCSCSGRPTWLDRIEGGGVIAQMAGSLSFSAVSTSTGDLQVYSAAGRRLFPAMQLGCRTAFMYASTSSSSLQATPSGRGSGASADWLLLVVCVDGSMRLWDLQQPACVLETSVAPLLTQPGIEVSTVRFSSTGCPLVVLSNCHAHSYHSGMKCWMRVADDSLPASVHHSSFLKTSAAGDLALLQQAASSQLRAEDVVGAALGTAPAWQVQQGRAHLEVNMAAAKAMDSPMEWRRWLITYVRQLSADADEVRLQEVIAELLGPIRWSKSSHPSDAPGSWQPSVMGLDKRQILKNEVLKEVARNRSNQRLVLEVLDLIKEVEAVQRGA